MNNNTTDYNTIKMNNETSTSPSPLLKLQMSKFTTAKALLSMKSRLGST